MKYTLWQAGPIWSIMAIATCVVVYTWYGFWWAAFSLFTWPIWVAVYLAHRFLAS